MSATARIAIPASTAAGPMAATTMQGRETGAVANIAGALLADGLQSGTARATGEMVKTAVSQGVGIWAWQASAPSVMRSLKMQSTPGFDLPMTAVQSVVQGSAAWLACTLSGMPRSFMRSWIDAAAGATTQRVVSEGISI